MKERLQTIGKEIAAFFTSPIILKNVGLVIAALLGLLFITSFLMNQCTRNGESWQVDQYIGMDLRDAIQQAERNSGQFRITVLDSIDRGNKPPNQVVSQNPAPFSRVKKGRNIYLTVTKYERIETTMPQISEKDEIELYKNALAQRELKAVIRKRVANRRYAPGTILKVFHNDKELTFRQIDKGYQLQKGSTIEFVVTEYGAGFTTMPSLACKRFEEVEVLLEDADLVLGNVQPDVTVSDRATAFVYKTVPQYTASRQLRKGQQVDIYLTQDLPDDCEPIEVNYE
ncbi:MAG: PASTA domain-containing protein [Bacteroidota bacterium]